MRLLSKKRTLRWLDNIITGDEKWVLYVNHTRRRSWVGPSEQPKTIPKPEIHAQKTMLSVWWGVHGIVYWELLPPNTTVTAKVYCNQLDNLKAQLETYRPEQKKSMLPARQCSTACL